MEALTPGSAGVNEKKKETKQSVGAGLIQSPTVKQKKCDLLNVPSLVELEERLRHI